MGTLTPASRPTSRDQIPAQLTANSQRIAPRSVSTRAMAPLLASNPVTSMSSMMRTPFIRAPAASAMAASEGLAIPSLGT